MLNQSVLSVEKKTSCKITYVTICVIYYIHKICRHTHAHTPCHCLWGSVNKGKPAESGGLTLHSRSFLSFENCTTDGYINGPKSLPLT